MLRPCGQIESDRECCFLVADDQSRLLEYEEQVQKVKAQVVVVYLICTHTLSAYGLFVLLLIGHLVF